MPQQQYHIELSSGVIQSSIYDDIGNIDEAQIYESAGVKVFFCVLLEPRFSSVLTISKVVSNRIWFRGGPAFACQPALQGRVANVRV